MTETIKRDHKDTKEQDTNAVWRFRREISVGVLIQLVLLLGVIMVGWSNLQRELVQIHCELKQLNAMSLQGKDQLGKLIWQVQGHECRVLRLEEWLAHKETQPVPYDQQEQLQ